MLNAACPAMILIRNRGTTPLPLSSPNMDTQTNQPLVSSPLPSLVAVTQMHGTPSSSHCPCIAYLGFSRYPQGGEYNQTKARMILILKRDVRLNKYRVTVNTLPTPCFLPFHCSFFPLSYFHSKFSLRYERGLLLVAHTSSGR
jgi:hypothetical protein